MIVKKNPVWGTVIGKLSLTPAQAKRMFNFDMHPDAKGVVLQRYTRFNKNHLVIKNFFPYHFSSQKVLKWNQKFKPIPNISHQLKDIIRNVWNPLARSLSLYSGNALFIGENAHRIYNQKNLSVRKWNALLLTKGELPPPILKSIKRPHTIKLLNYNSSYQVGSILFDPKNFKFFSFPPKALLHPYISITPFTALSGSRYGGILHYSITPPFFIFVYYKYHNKYSDSANLFIKRRL